jgi:hypothetical protein
MPRERVLGDALRYIGLAQNIPGYSLNALIGPGDAGYFGFHHVVSFQRLFVVAYLPGVQSLA